MSLTFNCYCHLYEDEPWAKAARRHGYEPCNTESSARHAFACMQGEIDEMTKALKPFAQSLERYSGFTEYALFGIWEDVNGAAGRKLNILRKSDFDKAQGVLTKFGGAE